MKHFQALGVSFLLIATSFGQSGSNNNDFATTLQQQDVVVSPVSTVNTQSGLVTTKVGLMKLESSGSLDFSLTLSHTSNRVNGQAGYYVIAPGWSCGFDSYSDRADFSQGLNSLLISSRTFMSGQATAVGSFGYSQRDNTFDPRSGETFNLFSTSAVQTFNFSTGIGKTYSTVFTGQGYSNTNQTTFFGLSDIRDIRHPGNVQLVYWKTIQRNGLNASVLDRVEDVATNRKFVFSYRADGLAANYIDLVQNGTLVRTWKIDSDQSGKLTRVTELIGTPERAPGSTTTIRSLEFTYTDYRIASYRNERNHVWSYSYEPATGANFNKCTSVSSPGVSQPSVLPPNSVSFAYNGDTSTVTKDGKTTSFVYETIGDGFAGMRVLRSVQLPPDQLGRVNRKRYRYNVNNGVVGIPIEEIEEVSASGGNWSELRKQSRDLNAYGQAIRIVSASGESTIVGYASESDTQRHKSDLSPEYTAQRRYVGSSSTPTWVIRKYVYDGIPSSNLLYTIDDPVRIRNGVSDQVVERAIARINSFGGALTNAQYDAATHIDLRSDVSSYYPNGEVASVESRGATTYFSNRYLNGSNSTQIVTSPFGATTTTTFDSLDRPLTVTKSPLPDGSSAVTSNAYDDLSSPRSQTVTQPDGTYITTWIDGCGNTTKSQASSGVVTLTSFDELNRPYRKRVYESSAVNAKMWEWNTVYDATGQVASLSDPAGKVTSFAYDNFGRKVQTNLPGGQVDTFEYDVLGRISKQVVGFGASGAKTTTMTYDVEDRVLTDGDAPGISGQPGYLYNPDGSLRRLQKDSTNFIEYVYDNLGRKTLVTQTVQGKPLFVGYKYDTAGRLAVEAFPGERINYFYRFGDVVARITDSRQRPVASYAYNMDGTLSWYNAGPIRYSPTFDSTGRVKTMHYEGVASYTRTFDANGEMATAIKYEYSAAGESGPSTNGLFWSYQHDALGQLTYENVVGSGTRAGASYARRHLFTYDNSGNRSAATRINPVLNTSTVNSYAYTLNNRMTNAEGSVISYDSAGTPLSITTPQNATRTFSYDANRRLNSISDSTGVNQLNLFDGDGRRVVRTDQSGTTRFLYDGELKVEIEANGVTTLHLLDDVLYRYQNTNTSLNPSALLGTPVVPGGDTPGPGALASVRRGSQRLSSVQTGPGEPGTTDTDLELIDAGTVLPPDFFDLVDANFTDENSGSGPMASGLAVPTVPDGFLYLFQNFQGSTFRVMRSTRLSGYILDRESEYTAFGETLFESIVGGDYSLNSKYKAKPGYITDSSSGYDYLGERVYSPRWGRFLSQDPIAERAGLNFYSYCGNSPLGKSDPTGLFPQFTQGFLDQIGKYFGPPSPAFYTPDIPFKSLPQNPSWSLAQYWFGEFKAGKLRPSMSFNESSNETKFIRDSWIGRDIMSAVKGAGLKNGAKMSGAFSTTKAAARTAQNLNEGWAAFQGAGTWSAWRSKDKIYVHYWNTTSYNSYALHMGGNQPMGRPYASGTFHMYWIVNAK